MIGAAALWVGLAVNVQAISISIPANLDEGAHSWIWKIDQSDLNQSPASSLPATMAAAPIQLASMSVSHGKQKESKKPSPPPGQDPKPATVPESGMTLMMLGGVFCGLALWERKLKYA